jgi:hypothetical protein
MFEFNKEVVNRGGYRFIAEIKDWKFTYKTSDKKEIEILEENGFKNKIVKEVKKTTNSNKNENNK